MNEFKLDEFLYRHRNLIFVSIAIVFSSVTTYAITNLVAKNESPRVVYSLDKRENDKEIISIIDSANEYVYFAVYYFTHKDIAEALVRAKRRGLTVEGITDREGIKQSSNQSVYNLLRGAGIPVITQKHQDGIMHIKTIVTEKSYASGSYNWTVAATEANDEVLEIGRDENLRKQYLEIVKRVIMQNKSSSDDPLSVRKIDYTDAPRHIGDYAEVSGTIVKNFTSQGGTTFLDFCKTSAKCPFAAVIFASDSDKFGNVSKYSGNVTISGVLRSYKGKAEIVISSPDQIVVK